MAQLRRNGPYIWVTWLTQLLVGENSCEWAAWFRTQHESWSWEKVPSTFDQVAWQLAHTTRLNEVRERFEKQGYVVLTENQNSFILRSSRSGIAIGGKPDLIARKGSKGVVIDVKTGKPSPSHGVQVMTYMWAVPRALGQYQGITFSGLLAYNDYEIEIPASAIDKPFTDNLARLVSRVGDTKRQARKVPSAMECGFCPITHLGCPERAATDDRVEGETDDF